MSTYVLVHGAWHGSWCWKRVRNALQAAGHDVFTPTLTGVGERSHLNSSTVNLDTHIADVVNLIRWEELSDVILCGHSYGGCVISGAADRIPERIAALVYLDAFVLDNGESLFHLVPEAQVQGMTQQAQTTGDGFKVMPIPAEVFRVNPADSAWVNAQCTAQPLATFVQSVQLTGGLSRIANITHVLATGWEGSPFPACHERAKAKGWKTQTIACGHDVMLDQPGELTRLLIDVARQSATA